MVLHFVFAHFDDGASGPLWCQGFIPRLFPRLPWAVSWPGFNTSTFNTHRYAMFAAHGLSMWGTETKYRGCLLLNQGRPSKGIHLLASFICRSAQLCTFFYKTTLRMNDKCYLGYVLSSFGFATLQASPPRCAALRYHTLALAPACCSRGES